MRHLPLPHKCAKYVYRTKPHTYFKILDIPLPHTNVFVYFSHVKEKTITWNLDTWKFFETVGQFYIFNK